MSENEELIREARAEVAYILKKQSDHTPGQLVDAIEALIDAKLAEFADRLSDRIEQSSGIRP